MKILLLAAVIAATPSAAQERQGADVRYHACYGFTPDAIVITRPARMTGDVYGAWYQFIRSGEYVPIDKFRNLWGLCLDAESAEEVEREIVKQATSYRSSMNQTAIKRIDWIRPGDEKLRDSFPKEQAQGSARPKKPAPVPKSSVGYLTIKSDTSLTDARKEYEQAVLKAQRDDAAARAKQVADTARNQVEMKAKLDKFFEQLRKRGSAQ